MKKFMVFIIGASMVACSKDKNEEDKLPKPLQEIIANMSCYCDPSLIKYDFRGEVIYNMVWNGFTCDVAPVYFDANGNQISIARMSGVFENRKTVWKCIP
jgi:hypothetical protein